MRDASVPAPPQFLRAWLLIAVLVGVAAIIVCRLYQLQVVRHGELLHMAERQQTRTWTLPAARGSIVDAQGVPLALSQESWAVYADPGYMSDKLSATIQLSALLKMDRAELRAHFSSPANGRLVQRGLSLAQREAVDALKLDGIYCRPEFRRAYPQGSLAAQVLGFVREDGSGGAGLETRFETHLAGNPGSRTMRVDARGRALLGEDEGEEIPARPGQHLQLTLVAQLQKAAEDRLAEAIRKHKAERGAVVMVRPQNGDILAMASWPNFNLDEVRDQGLKDLTPTANQALLLTYESGSTVKPLVAGAAVAEGIAQWEERIFCENGVYTYRQGRAVRTIHDHSYKHGGHQWLTVAEGIAKSDNILMAKLGLRLGPERLHHWIAHLGFGVRTGIDLPGEQSGTVHPLTSWTPTGACMSVPMGHEFAVTPLQMAMAHAAVANRGLWNPPRIVERIFTRDPELGHTRDLLVPALGQPRRLFTAEDSLRIQDSMRLVMEEGTGQGIQLNGYSSAGKTGTTEKLIGGQYSKDRHIGSFVGWAPARSEQLPEVLVLVVIDDPRQNGHYGSQTAGPVARDLLQQALEFFHVPEDEPRRAEVARE